jgi:CheY-like chemotaxis protein
MAEADKVYIYRNHHEAKLAHITNEWLNPGTADMPASTASFSLDNYKWPFEKLNKTEIIFISDTDKLPREALNEKKVLKEQGVRSLFAYPFKIGNKLEGFIGIEYIKDPYTLPEESLEIMKIAAAIIGFSLERKHSEKSLKRTDQMMLNQILGSIIENAIKFASSGQVEYGYSIIPDKPDAAQDQRLLFFIKDTGIGISKKDKDRVFERFVKIADKDAYLHRGAGLGLALARDLTHLLGGEIWVESSLGKGSTFYFTVPYKAPSMKKDDQQTDASGQQWDWTDKTILIAEDTESNYLYIEELLGPTNAKLIRATDGLEAIELFRANKDTIDLVFMDILMPEYDGFEATQLNHLQVMIYW